MNVRLWGKKEYAGNRGFPAAAEMISGFIRKQGFLSRREEWIMEAVFKARLIMQKEIEQIFSAGGKMKPFWPGLCCRGGRRWQSIV